MKKNLIIVVSVLGLGIAIWFMIGMNKFGPGTSDYSFRIANMCNLVRSSAYMVSVGCEGFERGIDPEIIKIGWNDNYLVALSHPVTKKIYPNNPDNTYAVPDESVTYWWILDFKNKSTYGPLNSETEFNDQKQKLQISNIELITPDEAIQIK
jgi:hypothetical protein